MKAADVAKALGGTPSGSGFVCRCVAHDDQHASLSVGDGERGLIVHCHAGCESSDIIEALKARSLWPAQPGRSRIVAAYDYRDATGDLKYQVVRMDPKGFRQRRPDGAGGWIWNLAGTAPIPYMLPQLLQAVAANQIVFIPEGEKDADALRGLGLAATCNSGGAGKWRGEFAQYFRGATICVLPDNDDAGRDHAHAVADNLVPVAASVTVLELPNLPPKGDVSDWLAAGGDADKLTELMLQTPEWKPRAACADPVTPVMAASATPFVALPLSEVPATRPAQAIQNLFAGFTVVAGPPNSGKSALTIDAALHVAAGIPFFGRKVRRGAVLYIAAEAPGSVAMRARAALREKFDSKALPFFLCVDAPRLGSDSDGPLDTDRLISTAASINEQCGEPVRLAVFDTLAAMMAGADENGGGMIALVANVQRFATATGAVVVLLHHPSKADATGLRGHSSLYAAADTVINISTEASL